MVKVLLVEDDHKIAAAVCRGLEAEGFTVEVASDGDRGYWLASESRHDVIVLDLMLPGRNGYRICADLRAAGNWTPVLVLTAKQGELDESDLLDLGADDYLSKPFSFVVLVARLRSLLRRAADRPPVPYELGDLRLDSGSRRAFRGDTEIALTAREYDVLEFFVRRPARVLGKDEILAGVWTFDFDGDANIVEVYVGRLRRKIDRPFGRSSIQTVRGSGYRIDADG